jgi:UDP-glucose 4-epimerase
MVTQDLLPPPDAAAGGTLDRSTILVTGGAGFIGSHVCVELLAHGYDVVVVDNHSNSFPAALARVADLAGRPLAGAYQVDLRDRRTLREVFARHPVDAVMHFAAMKAVGESMRIPLDYYDNNIGGTTSLLRMMREHGVGRLVFSSSCSIYGAAQTVPIAEDAAPGPTNPYATSKWICEQMLTEACRRYPDLAVLSLRYFNPVGAHPSGLLGEVPRSVPNNVMPYLMQVATGRLDHLVVHGGDYDTPDGTAIRDYIHVVDLAEAHRIGLDLLGDGTGMTAFNLGTGRGTSVLELVDAVGQVCGRRIPYRVSARRPGDVATLIADPAAVAREWGWRTTRDLAAMCADAWRFQQLHPDGYPDTAVKDAAFGDSAFGDSAVMGAAVEDAVERVVPTA